MGSAGYSGIQLAWSPSSWQGWNNVGINYLIWYGQTAGINLAKGLRGVPLDILLVDRHNYHLFQPLLYQVATAALSPADIAYPIRRIFRSQLEQSASGAGRGSGFEKVEQSPVLQEQLLTTEGQCSLARRRVRRAVDHLQDRGFIGK